jgi:hypothetical protein
MNLKVICSSNGGIFSRFSRALQGIMANVSLEILQKTQNIYFEPESGEINQYDFVLYQEMDPNTETHILHTGRSYKNWTSGHEQILLDTKFYNFEKANLLKQKILFRKEIMPNFKNIFFDEQVLGVHVRLTDMNKHHPYLVKEIDSDKYIQTILSNCKEYRTIFVASDNTETLKKIKTLFQDQCQVLYNNNRFIVQAENDTNLDKIQTDNMNKKEFWIEAFRDMWSLSKCSFLIYGISNLNNVSFIFNDEWKKTILVR